MGENKRTLSNSLVLAVCCVGILGSYLAYGFIQEQLGRKKFKLEGEEGEGKKFKFVSFSLLVQSLVNCTVASIALLFLKSPSTTTSTTTKKPEEMSFKIKRILSYIVLAGSHISAMFCSSKAVYHIDYPTMVVSKCCKPIPVLVFGLIFGKKKGRYPPKRIAAVMATTVAVAVFMHESATSKENTKSSSLDESTWGLGAALLASSLFLDGLTGFMQDFIVDTFHRIDPETKQQSPWLLMRAVNAGSVLFMLIVSLLSGEATKAIEFCRKFPQAAQLVLCIAAVSTLGQCFIFVMIAKFDSLLVSCVTTVRKFCSILLSVVWFGHPLNWKQWLTVFGAFGSIGYELYQKAIGGNKKDNKPEQKQKQQPKKQKKTKKD